MTAREIISEVWSDLNDDGTRWSELKMLGYVNRAQSMVAMLRPDASSTILVEKLQAGSTRQAVPATARLLLGLTRNMGSDGTTPGRPITGVDQKDLDASNMAWHSEAASNSIFHFTYDEKTPSVYFVSPAPAHNVHVEMSISVPPATVTDLSADLALCAIWKEAVMEWVKRCAYGLNEGSMEDVAKGKEHERSFYVMLGDEARVRMLASPNTDTKEVAVS